MRRCASLPSLIKQYRYGLLYFLEDSSPKKTALATKKRNNSSKEDQSHSNGDFNLRHNVDRFQYLKSQFTKPPDPSNNNDNIYYGLIGLYIAMFGMAFACIPLYEYFCQQYGYLGATKRAKVYEPPQEGRKCRMFEVDFISHSHVNWEFKPAQKNVVISPGETTLAFYTAKNIMDKPIIGIAAYHVIPDEAGFYFNKIQCFCFEEQLLNPGEEVDLPVLFFLDPDILKDKKLLGLDKITLTYTFFEANSEIPPEYKLLSGFGREANSKNTEA